MYRNLQNQTTFVKFLINLNQLLGSACSTVHYTIGCGFISKGNNFILALLSRCRNSYSE